MHFIETGGRLAISPIDRIGDRLDHPENVPEELKHLIADDVARVEKILSIPVSGRILDVGCSDGAITKRIRERWQVEAVGADIRQRANLRQWVQWDVRQPWPGFESPLTPPFDAAYACEVFEHLTDADAQLALTNILAVLKPGGRLIVTVPNRSPHDLYEVGCRSRWAWPDHRSSYSLLNLSMWLRPYLADLAVEAIYPGEQPVDSIWLVAHGVKR